MKTCENCKWFDGYTGEYYAGCKKYLCVKLKGVCYYAKDICKFYERETMDIDKAYEILQAGWVKLCNVDVGDTVKVLKEITTDDELGSYFTKCGENRVGNTYKVARINKHGIELDVENKLFVYPFFCLEFVKKGMPKIELTCKVNDKIVPLSTLSEETLLKIRRQSIVKDTKND